MSSLCGSPRAAARPGALLYSHGKSPSLTKARSCSAPEGSLPEQAQGLDGLARPVLARGGQDLGVPQGSGWALEEPTSTF